jgi:hypothetical protein
VRGWRAWAIGGVLGLAAIVSAWAGYSNSTLGECHGLSRKVGEYRMGYGLKQMMSLPVDGAAKERFHALCDTYLERCGAYLDEDVVQWCRLP